jgi:hypothetical protein
MSGGAEGVCEMEREKVDKTYQKVIIGDGGVVDHHGPYRWLYHYVPVS